MELVRQCFRFREMLAAFTRRELKQRYIGSVLGRPWPFLQPLLMLGVYYVVFVNILKLRMPPQFYDYIVRLHGEAYAPYAQPIYICCGLLCWLMTAEYTVRSVNLIVENGNLVKKVAFPAELLPVSLLGSYVINLLVVMGVFCAVIWLLTPFMSPMVWLVPLIVLVHAMFLLGIAYLLSTANVFVRDVSQLVPLVVNLWFFLTPVVYMKEMLGNTSEADFLWIFDWNPMAYIVDLYRNALVYSSGIQQEMGIGLGVIFRKLLIVGAIALATLVVGYKVFMANKHKFADEL